MERISPSLKRFAVFLGLLVAVMGLFGFAIFVTARGIVRAGTTIADIADQYQRSFIGVLPVTAGSRGAVSIFFAGDVMLDRTVNERMQKNKDDIYPFRKILTDARFTKPDLRLMNLEGPVTPERRPPEKSIDFAFDPRVIPALQFVGWNGMSQANNHSRDQGQIGAADSLQRLRAAHFIAFGDEVRDDDVAIATTTVNGRRIAFVGFNDTSRAVDETVAEQTLKDARAVADTVIVMMHWGEEYHDQPTPRQQSLAKWLIDHGADAVVGGHPHWAEGISSYKGKPIVYSLGNFVFDQDWSQKTNEGLAIGLLVSDHETVIELDPVVIKNSQPSFLDGAAREAKLRDLASISDAALTQQILNGRVTFPVAASL